MYILREKKAQTPRHYDISYGRSSLSQSGSSIILVLVQQYLVLVQVPEIEVYKDRIILPLVPEVLEVEYLYQLQLVIHTPHAKCPCHHVVYDTVSWCIRLMVDGIASVLINQNHLCSLYYPCL